MPAEALNDPEIYESDAPPPARRGENGEGHLIRFFVKPERRLVDEVDEESKEKVKRWKWFKKEMVQIRVPGDKLNSPVKEVTPLLRERYANQYARWKAGADQNTAGGWPLEKWPNVDVAQVEQLKAESVYTVEQLAGLSDANLRALGPMGRKLRQEAMDFLAAAKSAAPMAALREENNKLQSQMEALVRTNSDLAERLKKLEKAGKEKAA